MSRVSTLSNKGHSNKPNGKDRPICSHCGIIGHVVDKCYKIHGYPLGYKAKGKVRITAMASSSNSAMENEEELTTIALTQSQCHQLMSMLQSASVASSKNLGTHQAATVLSQISKPASTSNPFNSAGNDLTSILEMPHPDLPFCLQSSVSLEHSVFSSNLTIPFDFTPNDWIIDSGATDPMVHSITLLTKITSVAHISVKLPNGESVFFTHIGQVQLSTDLILDNVLCIPSFSFNLISIGKLTHHLKCCCVFLSHFCFAQD